MSETEADVAATVQKATPLCVDLDGTLVRSDTLHDSLLVLLRTRPAKFFALIAKLMQGKAAFKAYLGGLVVPDVANLPYNQKLLAYLRSERARGREIYLATGADTRLAERVASHLGVFSGVLASEGEVNLTGNHKLNRLRETLSDSFAYIGNASADLPLLLEAAEPMVANPSLSLRAKLRANGIRPAFEFDERGSRIGAFLKALRVHQWAKNILIFLPMLLGHRFNTSDLFKTFLAFLCFSFAASGTYVINDLFDMEADRRHPRKRLRPFAAGDLSVGTGAGIVVVFLGLGLGGAFFLPTAAFAWMLVYLATTLAYSFYLKRVALVDVLVLSGLYTLRLLVGGGATGTPISQWLAGFSVFVFFSLALVKRFAELENLRSSDAQPRNGRGYLLGDLAQLRSFGTASAYAAVVVFAIYISSQDVMAHYRRPARLWLAVPLLLLWLSRTWLLASRGELNEDPVVFAFTDRMSLLIGIAVAAIALLAL